MSQRLLFCEREISNQSTKLRVQVKVSARVTYRHRQRRSRRLLMFDFEAFVGRSSDVHCPTKQAAKSLKRFCPGGDYLAFRSLTPGQDLGGAEVFVFGRLREGDWIPGSNTGVPSSMCVDLSSKCAQRSLSSSLHSIIALTLRSLYFYRRP